MLVRFHYLPLHLRTRQRFVLLNQRQLFLAAEIVADVPVVDRGLPCWPGWIFDQERDGDGRAGTSTKNIACFSSSQFPLRPSISPQIEDVDRRKLPL